jgi:hypothetical protein
MVKKKRKLLRHLLCQQLITTCCIGIYITCVCTTRRGPTFVLDYIDRWMGKPNRIDVERWPKLNFFWNKHYIYTCTDVEEGPQPLQVSSQTLGHVDREERGFWVDRLHWMFTRATYQQIFVRRLNSSHRYAYMYRICIGKKLNCQMT